MARNSDTGFRNGSPQKQEPPTFQVPLSITLKARSRPNQQDSRDKDSNSNRDKDEDEGGEEEFRILQYPGEPWGRASRSRSSALIPSRRLISALIEDTRLATDSQDSTDTSRNRRSRRTNNNTRRVSLLLKRPRSLSITTASIATESSDDGGSTFHRKKSATSSTKKRPTKQQRIRQHSHSDDSITTPATVHLAVQKSRGRPPVRQTITMPEEESEDEEVGAIAVDEVGSEDEAMVANDSANDTYQSNYIPGQRTISPKQQQQERLARSRKRSILVDDEDEGQAAGVQEQEQEQELGQAVEMPEVKPSVRYIERMDCVLIPVIDIVERRSLVRRNRDSTQSAASMAPTGRVATKDTNKHAEKEDDSRTMSTVPKDTTSTTQVRNLTPTTNSRLGPRKDPVATPEIDVDTPRQTRSDVRKNVAVKPEPTTAATVKSISPTVSQDLAPERNSTLRQVAQAPKDIEPPRKTTTSVKPPRKATKDVPVKPLPSGVQAKNFHGWWLKRKEGLAQEGNLGILVQGNMLEPKAMIWHTSTIKDAPEPTLVMTFSGSFYRLNGSIDAQKSEDNGFSKDVIKAFKNGFPADWKRLLSKDDGMNMVSSVSSGKDMPNNEGNNAAQRSRQPPQQLKQVAQQTRQPSQQKKRTTAGIRPEEMAVPRAGETRSRTAVISATGVTTPAKPAPSSPRTSIFTRPTHRTPSQGQPFAVVIPAVSSNASFLTSAVPKGTKEALSKNPSPILQSTDTNLTLLKKTPKTKESTPSKERAPVREVTPAVSTPPTSETPKALESIQRDSAPNQLSSPRRASTPSGVFLQGEALALRRASVPELSVAAGEPWKFVGQNAAAVDRSLDGNLRMRSKAVVEQIREHTRQHVDPIEDLGTTVGLGEMHDPVEVAADRRQGLEGRSTTGSIAKSLSSISASSQSTFEDYDFSRFGDVDSFGRS